MAIRFSRHAPAVIVLCLESLILQGPVVIDLTAGIGADGALSIIITNSVPIVSFQMAIVDSSGEPLVATSIQFDTPTQPEGSDLIADGNNTAGIRILCQRRCQHMDFNSLSLNICSLAYLHPNYIIAKIEVYAQLV